MLRISPLPKPPHGIELKLEGKLREPWLAELRVELTSLRAARTPLCLELSAVTFVDDAGIQLLKSLIADGVEVAGCSDFVANLLFAEKRQ
jgi:anti-anti-sigma regulatory factor